MNLRSNLSFVHFVFSLPSDLDDFSTFRFPMLMVNLKLEIFCSRLFHGAIPAFDSLSNVALICVFDCGDSIRLTRMTIARKIVSLNCGSLCAKTDLTRRTLQVSFRLAYTSLAFNND